MFKASTQDNNGHVELVGKYVEVNTKGVAAQLPPIWC